MNNLVFCIVTIQYIFYMMQNTLTDSTIHSTEPLTNSIQKQNPWAILFRTLDPFYSEMSGPRLPAMLCTHWPGEGALHPNDFHLI